MNVKKIQRLMRKYGLSCPIRKANPYRRMAKALKTNNVAGNLLNREFTAHGARSMLLTDITYIPYNGTFCYLSTILDAYTKQVLSYAVSTSLELDFVLECINLLVEKHGKRCGFSKRYFLVLVACRHLTCTKTECRKMFLSLIAPLTTIRLNRGKRSNRLPYIFAQGQER